LRRAAIIRFVTEPDWTGFTVQIDRNTQLVIGVVGDAPGPGELVVNGGEVLGGIGVEEPAAKHLFPIRIVEGEGQVPLTVGFRG
jgi:hypothetical protein